MSPPALNIPRSAKTVSVSVIDSTSDITAPTGLFFSPSIPGYESFRANSFSFLIEHPPTTPGGSPRRLLFDLGTRSDWATGFSPAAQKGLAAMLSIKTSSGERGSSISVKKDVHTILRDGGVDPDSVEAIVWSHAHIDHTGNPALFGPGTALIVGPGFGTGACGCHGSGSVEQLQPHIFPGYPEDPDSLLLETDYKGRTLRELTSAEFDRAGISIASLPAIDYFGDGSFYLLDTPGHAPGHLCGLARVADIPELPNGGHFVLMVGDGIHHMGELRPSPYKPLPEQYVEGGLLKHFPDGAADKALFKPAGTKGASMHLDPEQATATINKLQVFDADSNVFVIAAHDTHIFDVLNANKGAALFPDGTVNDFVARGFVKQTQWTFLKDFGHLMKEKGAVV